MATVERPLQRPVSVPKVVAEPTGWLSWLSTVDHKRIGIIYLVSAFVFFVIGGIEALLMRLQLATPNGTVLSPDVYNQLMTMHGTTMVFLAVMPLNVGLGNYIVPLMIGARDMAFPRLNALSIWLFILGGLMLYSSFMLGGAPNAGWFAYAPLTEKGPTQSPTHGMDYWILGLTLTGVASIAGGINFIVTILNMRAPGMKLNRMPLFVWATLVTSFIIIFAFPSLTVAQVFLLFDRNFGTRFFLADQGGDPMLWLHLFWFFGHPEVYILILPVFGLISEVLPTFSRKPIFGYAFIAYSSVAIGFLGFLVWAHHMFGTGLGPIVDAFFSGASMLIAIPTGVKIFNWIGTLYGGSLQLKSAMYFALGFIAMFVIGGISGITLASPPVDLQQTDTYYVVAHFHYVLFGGSIFGLFAGAFYWFPKMTGRMLNERLGKIQFWILLVAFNVTFGPMHELGTQGMPRRIYTYQPGMGWDFWNMVETIASFGIAIAVAIFMWNVIVSLRSGQRATNDPWDAATLEWSTASPPPVYNFAKIPRVHSRRPLWDSKYPDMEVSHAQGTRPMKRKEVAALDTEDQDQALFDPSTIHLPSSTFGPLWVALAITIVFYGILYLTDTGYLSVIAIVAGLGVFAFGVTTWLRSADRDNAGAH